MITMYGITNCSTVQKARKWLEDNKIEYEFWDYKKSGIDEKHLLKWCQTFGWEKVLNMQGMMWRKADENEKKSVIDEKTAIDFMIKTPNSIKRPILETESTILLGFELAKYQTLI